MTVTKDQTNVKTLTLQMDGELVEFTEGETIYEVADRHRKDIPTLPFVTTNDSRLLEPVACA